MRHIYALALSAFLVACALLSFQPLSAEEEVTVNDLAGLCIFQDTLRLFVGAGEEVVADQFVGPIAEPPVPAVAVGVTEERLRTMIQSRMRAARIYAAGSPWDAAYVPYLSVTIDSMAHPNSDDRVVFVSEISLSQWVENPSVRAFRPYESWSKFRFGIGGDDFIMQTFSEQIDQFIGEFLRVNESQDCAQALENTSQHWRLRNRNNDYLRELYRDDPITREFRAYLGMTLAQREHYAELSLDDRSLFVAFVNMSKQERDEFGALPRSERAAYVERFWARQEAD